jgi:hypothetical protein
MKMDSRTPMRKMQVAERPGLRPIARLSEIRRHQFSIFAMHRKNSLMQLVLGSRQKKDENSKPAERRAQLAQEGRDDYALKVKGKEQKILQKALKRIIEGSRKAMDRFIGTQVPQVEPTRP